MQIPIEAIPFLRFAKRLYAGPGSLQSIAYRQDVLCPEVTETIHPAIFLPGQVERVTRCLAYLRLEDGINAAVSTTITHCPTIAFHIKGAVLLDGSVYAGNYKHFVAGRSVFNTIFREAKHLDMSALASSYMGTKYFGHWLRDDTAQYLLAQASAPPLCVRRPAFRHVQAYEGYFNQDWIPTDRAWIDHLIVFQDFAQNHLKRSRTRLLRDRVRAHFRKDHRRRHIYLRRGNSGSPRLIENEALILDALVKHGFVVIDIESDGLRQIIETLLSAELVVSIEGSHVTHCMFACPENSGLLVLQPPDRFSSNHRIWTDCHGMRYGFVVGAKGGREYCFSPSEILRTIDRMLTVL